MPAEKNDRRTKYTKMVIRQSLLELMKNSSIDRITVKEICDLADINRGTFYSHYSVTYFLLSQIENELFSDIKKVISKQKTGVAATREIVREIFGVIAENGDLCKIVLGEHGDMEFLRKILYVAYERYASDWAASMAGLPEKTVAYVYDFVANGSVGIIRNWISGMAESAGEIATCGAQTTAAFRPL